MAHLALLGDSTLDNGAYTNGGPAVISQLRKLIPIGWRASLLAVDGATISGIESQLEKIPHDVDRIMLSVGGNDLLRQAEILNACVTKTSEALALIGVAARAFEAAYRAMLSHCLEIDRHAVICTVYSGAFPDTAFQRVVDVALAPFNDAIIRIGVENRLTIVDLRLACSAPADYANPIEPSVIGGGKIAKALLRAAMGDGSSAQSARIIG